MTAQITTARMPSGQARPAREPSSFEYATYICTTTEKLWAALTLNELRKHWWRGHTVAERPVAPAQSPGRLKKYCLMNQCVSGLT